MSRKQGGEGEQRRGAVGQTLVEYALIIAFVAALAIGSLLLFRPVVSSVLSSLSSSV